MATRAERREQERQRQAAIATRVFAKQRALRIIKELLRARGDRVSDWTHRDLVIASEEYLDAHPELVEQARQQARDWLQI